jgi:hypothetical protein
VEPAGEPKASFRWVPRRELANYQFPEANREVIALLVGDNRPRA